MTSNRFILIFLGIIFLLVVILSSNRIASTLKSRFGRFLPQYTTVNVTEDVAGTTTSTSISPTPTIKSVATIAISPPLPVKTGTPSKEIPATGPESAAFIFTGGSLLLGIALRRLGEKILQTNT